MGVPAFFRWLSRKYPSVIVECVENKVSGKHNITALNPWREIHYMEERRIYRKHESLIKSVM